MIKLIGMVVALLLSSATYAGTPLWSFAPLTATTISVPANSTATVQYLVTNHSLKSHTLEIQPILATTQITTGVGICRNPFTLQANSSCVLSLSVNGSQLTSPITNGPIVCQSGNRTQCYRPSTADVLRVTRTTADTMATISLSGSSLTLTVNGSSGLLTVHNDSNTVTATNIAPILTGTALDGHVTVTGNTCSTVAPAASCVITFTPGSSIVPATSFSIQGDNTNSVLATITIESGSSLSVVSPNSGAASGGTGVTLTGTGLTGATVVSFGGIAATSVNVVDTNTITAVTPAHAVGAVDVVVATPAGGASITNGYTYVATAVGQPTFGGTVACLGGGLQNLVTASTNNSNSISWGGTGIATGAQSDTDGAANNNSIITALGNNGGVPYAAKLCGDYEVDSQGNTPCEVGNTCYNDWYLPAKNQLNCLYTNQVAIGGFSASVYLTSTELTGFPTTSVWVQDFNSGLQVSQAKSSSSYVRCVRSFTP
jgi:IPT/TIG domain